MIDLYRLIDTININQVRFTDFYRLTTSGILQCVANKPITTLRRLLSQCVGGKEIGFLFICLALVFRYPEMLTLRNKFNFRNLSFLKCFRWPGL